MSQCVVSTSLRRTRYFTVGAG